MQTKLWCAVFASALLASTACKRTPQEKAEGKYEKPTERDMGNQPRGTNEPTNEPYREPGETGQVGVDMAKMRTDYQTMMRDRLTRIDGQISDLSSKTDPKSRDAVAKVRDERNALAAQIDQAPQQTQSDWDSFKKDTNKKADQLEKDLQQAQQQPSQQQNPNQPNPTP